MAVSGWWYVPLVFAVISVIALLVWLLITIFQRRIIPRDDPLVINFVSPHSEGRFIGVETSVEYGKGGRTVCSLEPRDLDVNYEGDPKLVSVPVDRGKRITLPRGTSSRDRNVNIYLPARIEDVPLQLRETVFGKAIMWATKLQDVENVCIDVLREGTTRRDELLKSLGDGEISKEFMEFTRELMKDQLESVVKATKAPEKGSISLTPGMQQQ